MAHVNFTIKPKVQEPRKFFIMYKWDSGYSLAEHVHDGLHERGVDAFLDKKDLKEGLTQEEWRKQRDEALDRSEVVLVIITHSCSSSPEVKYELKRALTEEKEIKVFVQTELWNIAPEMTFNLDAGQKVNIRDFQVSARFDDKFSLLGAVAKSTLITGIVSNH